MSHKLPRRAFLSQLSLAAASVVAVPAQLRAWAGKQAQPPMNPILSIQPLGFQWQTADPFLFCVHHEDFFPAGNEALGPAVSLQGRSLGDDFILKDGFRMYHGKTVPGFPGHPHRGFETVTVVRRGLVDHADSMGAAGRYGDGDVQWLTTGKGIQHAEMFPLLRQDSDNPMELFQIWLNLPARSKMVEPHFKMLWRDSIPNVLHTDASGKKTLVEVIAGTLGGHSAPAPPPDSWAADPAHAAGIWNLKLEAGASYTLPAAGPGINRVLYGYEGNGLQVAGTELPHYHAAQVHPEAEITLLAGETAASVLVLQGRPIGEPVVQYGPFVMNSRAEIQQAFDDYHRTKFGGWPWTRYDQVHPREKGRFARHANGEEELPKG